MPFFWSENAQTVSSWCFTLNILFSLKLGELIPIPDDSPPPPALSSNVSALPALLLAPSFTSTTASPWHPAPSSLTPDCQPCRVHYLAEAQKLPSAKRTFSHWTAGTGGLVGVEEVALDPEAGDLPFLCHSWILLGKGLPFSWHQFIDLWKHGWHKQSRRTL